MGRVRQSHKGLATKIKIRSNYPNQRLVVRAKKRVRIKKI